MIVNTIRLNVEPAAAINPPHGRTGRVAGPDAIKPSHAAIERRQVGEHGLRRAGDHDAFSTRIGLEGAAPVKVIGIDPGAVQDNAPGGAEAWVNADQVGHEGTGHYLLAAEPARVADRVASTGGELHVLAGESRPAGPAQAMAFQARGRVVDGPQSIAAVTARVMRAPIPGEELAPSATSSTTVGRCRSSDATALAGGSVRRGP